MNEWTKNVEVIDAQIDEIVIENLLLDSYTLLEIKSMGVVFFYF